MEKEETKQLAHQYIREFCALLKDKGHDISNYVKREFLPYYEQMKDAFDNVLSERVVVENVDILDKDMLIDFARQYRVEGSNQVAVYKRINDDDVFVYLAYCNNRELLPKEQNRYVVIKAEGMNRIAKEMFSESDLIILE